MKKVLITGITGQDGSYLAEFLLDKEYEVIGIKRRSSTNTLGRLKDIMDNPLFTVVEGDIVDPSSINQLVAEYQPQEIYNMAAQSHVHTSFQQPLYTFQVNALGVIHVLEAVRNYSPKTKVLQASTSELFGSNYSIDCSTNTKYQDEHTSFSPNSPYAVSKLAAHELIRLYRDAYGIFSCAAVSFNHESARRGEEFVTRKITRWIGRFVESGFDKKFPPLYLGNLDAIRDWSHAKDMMRGMWMMLQQDEPKDYVLCSGVGYSIKAFLDVAFSYVGINDWTSYIVVDPKFYRPCEVEFLQGRYDLIKQELGWEPKISFISLVTEMVDYDVKLAKQERIIHE